MSFVLFLFALGAVVWLSIRLSAARSLIARQAAENQHLQQEKTLVFDFLHDLGEAFSEDIDRAQLLDTILQCALRVTKARSGAIYLKNRRNQLVAETVHGLFPPPVALLPELENKVASRLEFLETVLKNEVIDLHSPNVYAEVCRNGVPLWIANARSDARFPQFSVPELQLQTLIAVPLNYRGETLGVVCLANHADLTSFTEPEFEVAKSVAAQAAFSLYNATVYTQLAEKKRLDRDLETAQEIQRILLPESCPDLPGFTLSATNLPAQRVSGDYYDFLRIDDHHWGLVIADVSGKGVPASLIMAMCRTVMRTQAAGCLSPSEVLKKANRILYPDIREDMFITLAYVVVDLREGILRVAKAGHDAPLLCKDRFQTVETLQSPGMALGIDSGEVFDSVIQDLTIPLQPGDTLLIYTDGVNEAVDPDGQEFGRDQVKTALKAAAPEGVDAVVHNLVERVGRFAAGAPQNDDITLVCLQKK
jgi:sigma-B regulation protein RsbU (phosphoserine phosphatase)